MNLARGLERRLENLVDGASASVFKGRMHPVMIGNKLIRQLDFLATETPAGPQIPNDLVVSMNPADIDPEFDRATLISELITVVAQTAREQGWRMVGPPIIQLVTDSTVPRGILGCTGSDTPGPLEPWGQLIADDGSAVLNVRLNRTIIGRGLECDIRIANEQISRLHALVTVQDGTVHIADLRSSNGTYVNATRVTEAMIVTPGDSVHLGDLSFTYRPVS
jgi:hypothetical protein